MSEHGYLVYYKDRYVELDYPKNAEGEQRVGTSFHHGRFIMKLREAAQSQSNVTCIAGVCLCVGNRGLRMWLWGCRVSVWFCVGVLAF